MIRYTLLQEIDGVSHVCVEVAHVFHEGTTPDRPFGGNIGYLSNDMRDSR